MEGYIQSCFMLIALQIQLQMSFYLDTCGSFRSITVSPILTLKPSTDRRLNHWWSYKYTVYIDQLLTGIPLDPCEPGTPGTPGSPGWPFKNINKQLKSFLYWTHGCKQTEIKSPKHRTTPAWLTTHQTLSNLQNIFKSTLHPSNCPATCFWKCLWTTWAARF